MIRTEIEKRFPGDHPRTVAVREYLASACEQLVHRGLADPKYTSELTSGSEKSFWGCLSEALIANHLRDKEFGSRGGNFQASCRFFSSVQAAFLRVRGCSFRSPFLAT
jgi:hypothetical protein